MLNLSTLSLGLSPRKEGTLSDGTRWWWGYGVGVWFTDISGRDEHRMSNNAEAIELMSFCNTLNEQIAGQLEVLGRGWGSRWAALNVVNMLEQKFMDLSDIYLAAADPRPTAFDAWMLSNDAFMDRRIYVSVWKTLFNCDPDEYRGIPSEGCVSRDFYLAAISSAWDILLDSQAYALIEGNL